MFIKNFVLQLNYISLEMYKILLEMYKILYYMRHEHPSRVIIKLLSVINH